MDSLPGARLVELTTGVFAYVQPPGGWCVGNAGVVVGDEQVVVVDTAATRARALALLAHVQRLAPGRQQVVVNTHHHGDHVFGNCVFAADAVVVAHELARAEMIRSGLAMQQMWPGSDWSGISLRLPTVTLHDRLTLRPGGSRRIELIHVGPAHTVDDVVAWLPDERILFAGDVLFSGRTPFVLMGSVTGSLRAIEHLRGLDPQTVVCGHGEVAGPGVFDTAEAYQRWLRGIAAAGVAGGLSPLEAARRVGANPFGHLPESERLVANLHRAYAEEHGEPPGSYISSRPVIREMALFHGGPLATAV